MIERHIDKKGTDEFQKSKLVITERMLKFSDQKPEPKGKKRKSKKVEPFFNINTSSKVLLSQNRPSTACNGGNSDSSDSGDFIPKLLKSDSAP